MTIQVKEFLNTIFKHKLCNEHILLAHQTDLDGGMYHAPWPSSAANEWKQNSKKGTTYFNISTVREPTIAKPGCDYYWRRRRQDCIAAYCLVCDGVGENGNSEPSVTPSWKLQTSEKHFQWGYLLERACTNLDYFEIACQLIADRGLANRGAGGYNNLIRIPGSYNINPGHGSFESKIIDWAPTKLFRLDQLIYRLGIEQWKIEAVTRKPKNIKDHKRARQNQEFQAEQIKIFDPLLDWLVKNNYVVEEGNKREGFINITCPWHETHTTGSIAACYSPLGHGRGELQQTRKFECFHANEYCREKAFREFLDWAVQKGAPRVMGHDPMPWIQKRYILVEREKLIADMEQRQFRKFWQLELEEFSNQYPQYVLPSNKSRPVSIKSAFIEHPDTNRAFRFAYDPTQAENAVLKINGEPFINLYLAPDHNTATKDDVPNRFLAHIGYLAPLPEETALLLDWLAFFVQYPDKRCFGLVIVAMDKLGINHSWLARLCKLIEPDEVNTTSLAQLFSNDTPNDWMAHCRLLIAEDFGRSLSKSETLDRHQIISKRISPHHTQFQCTNSLGEVSNETMYFNTLIFINDQNTLQLPEADCHLAVVSTTEKQEKYEYYELLEETLTQEYAARVYWWLKRRDISNFNYHNPPMTEGKSFMQGKYSSNIIKHHPTNTKN
ncbi:MAG: hypothetical protein CFH06_00819 [Alphaproteobacteria bacterium MarineAlpha3_Bin5]|mgnify:CR=1 FL=1|nr:MAG: hypothetical protein CFH06_00819 [Alphaproteobacteria bacterium MarineAlpha3_Bin5]